MEVVFHPRSEIDARIKRLRDQMGDMTGAILFQSVDLLYFSGTAQEGLIYIPKDPDLQPTVMIRKSLERAREESPLDVNPLKSLKSLDANLDIPPGAVIGLELDVLPYNNYYRVAQALKGSSFVDVSETIKMIRSIKSNFEVKLIKEAARMLDAGLSSVSENLVEGKTEIEMASKVEAEMRKLGHEGALRFRRFNHALPMGHLMSGQNAAVPSFVASPTGGRGVSLLQPQGPGFRKIKRNEPVLVDYGGVYNGYIADETRIFSIGKLSPELEDSHHAALEVQHAIVRELRSGATGKDLFNLSEAVGEQLGYKDHLGGPPNAKCGFVGHGVGLEIDEYPVLGPVDHQIESNMTIAIEPKMIYPGVGVVGIEDTFLTTGGRPLRLTKLSQDIWQV